MDAYEGVITKLDYRRYSDQPVSDETKRKVLQAARRSATGKNTQHWRFIVVEEPERLERLAAISLTGKWVAGANFAVIVLTDPAHGFHAIDAGRVAEDMQIAAWNDGVVSCVYTGMQYGDMRAEFGIPESLDSTIVVGFGHPLGKVTGRKKRRVPLGELASSETFGEPLRADLL
jgi:nitroreductase